MRPEDGATLGAIPDWTQDPPRTSGIYWYLDHRDQLAEDISVVEVHLDAEHSGTVYLEAERGPAARSGRTAAPLSRFSGVWYGPIAPLPAASTAAGPGSDHS